MKLYGTLISVILLVGCSIIGYYLGLNEEKEFEKNNIEVMAQNNIENLTETDAINLVREYMKGKKMYIPSCIEVDSKSKNIYTIHAYDVINDGQESHIATSGWYEVNIHTGKINDIIEN